MAKDIGEYFSKKINLPVEVKAQKFRIYLKLPILKELNLSGAGETDFLFLKIEIFQKFNFCASYQIEVKPIFKLNKSLLIKTFDLPTLMSTKIRAVLNRKWEKTDKNGKTILTVKGRDYFDLMWYLEKGIKPNMNCLERGNITDLKIELEKVVKKADSRSIRLDLENFVADSEFIKDLSKNIKDILIGGIKNL